MGGVLRPVWDKDVGGALMHEDKRGINMWVAL